MKATSLHFHLLVNLIILFLNKSAIKKKSRTFFTQSNDKMTPSRSADRHYLVNGKLMTNKNALALSNFTLSLQLHVTSCVNRKRRTFFWMDVISDHIFITEICQTTDKYSNVFACPSLHFCPCVK